MTENRFDYLNGKSDSFIVSHGLVEQTPEEVAMENVLMSSARSLSTMWRSVDDTKKIIVWDTAFEEYLEHRKLVIDMAPLGTYFPWNIQKEKGIQLVNGYSLNQGAQGSCAGAAKRNALLGSDLVNAKFAGYNGVTETGVDMVYAMARGNGRLNWGGGCNGTPLVKYGTEIGNYRTADVGKYDPRGSNVTQANFNNPTFKANALLHQSICCFLPDVAFETFYKVCSAGLSIWIGSPSFPASATIQGGISRVSNWTNGAHATCFQLGIEDTAKLLYFQNSHGERYAKDKDKFDTPRSGTWIDKGQFAQFKIRKEYGTPFVVFGELIAL